MAEKLKGWIKLHRKILDDPIFANEKLLKVWSWCLLNAAHKAHVQLVGRQNVQLNIGQFVTGRYAASKELNMAPTTVWDYLKILQKNNSIHIKSGNKFSVITVINWRLYQSQSESFDSKNDNKSTSKQQQTDTINNENNVKNVENSIYDLFEEYTENTMLRDALSEFCNLRKDLNAPLRVKSIKILLKELDSLSDSDSEKIKIIEQSILNNWKSLYQLKNDGGNNKQHKAVKSNKFNNFMSHDRIPGADEEYARKKREKIYKEKDAKILDHK